MQDAENCPKCQVPFNCLIGQSVHCHVEECFKLDHNILPECCDCHCNSTIPSHFSKFSHFRLAAVRSNAVVQLEKTLIKDVPSQLQRNFSNVTSENNNVGKINNKLSLKRKCSSSLGLPSKRQVTKKLSNTDSQIIRRSPRTKYTKEDYSSSGGCSVPRNTNQTKITLFFKNPKVEQNLSAVTPSGNDDVKLKLQENVKSYQISSQKHLESTVGFVKRGRNCPFFKRIPDTSFSVDAFSYGSIPGVKYYFLTHFHSDHYWGLKANFPHPIYCSKVTANLVLSKIKVQKRLLHILNINEPIVIDSVEVTPLDANHCPGSLLLLFELADGHRFLHTGDFRACPEMEMYPSLLRAPVNGLYLDTTFCDPHYKFPPQQAILDFVVSLVMNKVASKPYVLIVCGTYTIGKEKVFIALAEALNSKIWTNPFKLKVIHCLEDERINNRLASAPSEARVHVLPMNNLSFAALFQHLQQPFNKKYTEILAIKPTGWEYNSKFKIDKIDSLKPKVSGPVSIYGIPYSEHSSVDELKRFVQFLRPHRIIPTVSSNKEERDEMNYLFDKWLKS